MRDGFFVTPGFPYIHKARSHPLRMASCSISALNYYRISVTVPFIDFSIPSEWEMIMV